MRVSSPTQSVAASLAGLVAADGLSGGFVKDGETWRVLGRSTGALSHTGDTNATTLATVTIPAGAMGPSGIIRISSLWNYTNSGNTKTLQVFFNGTGGTAYLSVAPTTTASLRSFFDITNLTASSQVAGLAAHGSNGAWGTSGTDVLTSAVDTSAAVDVVFRVTLASAGETITLQRYLVELLYGA